MKKKNILNVLISVATVAALLTGCGSSEKAATETVAEANETTEVKAQTEVAEADDELEAIQKAGKIIVGVEGTYPPFTYHDDDGTLIGYDVEVAQNIAEYLGVEVEFVESDWDSLLAGVDSGRLDTVINDVTVTDERKEKYDFSEPYFFNSRQVVVKKGNPQNIKSLEDLNGKKVAINSTNAYIEELNELGVDLVPLNKKKKQINMRFACRTAFRTFNSCHKYLHGDYTKSQAE